MNSKTKNRIYCLDLIKIISIFFVFVHHILMDMYVVHPMHNMKLLETLTIRPNMNMAMIACGLFVMISGVTIAMNKREEGLFEFYKKRLTRVLIPFYIAYIIYFVIRLLTYESVFIYPDIPKWRFLFTLAGMDEYLAANGVRTFTLGVGEWFLGCIILCYLAFPLLYLLNKKFKALTFIVMTTYWMYLNLNYGKFNFTIASHMNFFCQIYNFYLGILFVELLPKLKKWLLFITIPIILFFYFYNNMIFIPDNFKTTIVITAILFTIYLFEKNISNNDVLRKIIMAFNVISFEIFLVHHFIIYQVDFMLGFRRLNGIQTLFVIGFDFAATIILAVVVERLSRKAYALMDKSKY